MGDFNSTLELEDRQGGTNHNSIERDDFLACTTALGLEDAFSVGKFFTSRNGNLWSRIYRVLINTDWHSGSLLHGRVP